MVSRIFSILKGEFFMSLFEQINKDYVTAYKAKDTQRVSVLRMLKASVKNRLVDLCRTRKTPNSSSLKPISPSLSLMRSSPASSKRPLPRPAPLLPRKWERS